MIENVPNEFKVLTNHEYPPYNRTIFEEFFMYNYGFKTVDLEYTYLPVLWTNLYISRNYSNGEMSEFPKFSEIALAWERVHARNVLVNFLYKLNVTKKNQSIMVVDPWYDSYV